MKRKTTNSKGFSLIELMVVVAVIGILVSLGTTSFKTYFFRAKRVEAKTNLSLLGTMAQSMLASNSQHTFCVNCPITKDEYDSPTACHNDNEFGFTLTDCTKARYLYMMLGGAGGVNIEAYEGLWIDPAQRRVFTGCTYALPDTWELDVTAASTTPITNPWTGFADLMTICN